MKIAWIGPMAKSGGGASGVSFQLLEELGSRGVQVDCYMAGEFGAVPQQLREHESLSFYCHPVRWQWNRWYSRNNLLAFVTGKVANLRAEGELARVLYGNHRSNPYDLTYQFSHIELSSLRRYRKNLPAIVLHPSVHAAGELRWHRRESHIARQTENWVIRSGVRVLLQARSFIQRRHIRIPARVLALSEHFAQDLVADYRVSPAQIDIVPNPIDLNVFHPVTKRPRTAVKTNRTVILFVSRIAVRKGVEHIVELSHRLDDLSGEIEIQIVGYKSLWSNYLGLLDCLNQRNSRYLGEEPEEQMPEVYRGADILIQPSKYEPFGLTVGEALASGVPVVASDVVGAAESVHPLCCRRFPCDDIEALEHEVRKLLRDISNKSQKCQISRLARAEAERLYSSSVVGDKLLQSFSNVISGEWHTTADTRLGLGVRRHL